MLATLVAYFPATQAGYIWDDDSYLTENHLLETGQGLAKLWFEPGSHPQYYPLVHTTYWLEMRLWGLNPMGYHLVNILFHSLSALLIWRIVTLLKIPGEIPGGFPGGLPGGLPGAVGWVAAVVFALHPVGVESVAWITERKNVLSTFCYLLGFLSAIGLFGLDGEKDRVHWRWLLPTLLCYVLALLSKTVTVSLPAAILVVVWYKWGKLHWRHGLAMLPLLIIGLTMGLHTAHMEQLHVGAVGQDWDISFLERCLIAGRIVVFYVEKLLYPANLIFIYPRWNIQVSNWLDWLPLLGVIAALLFLLFTHRKIGRGPLAAALLFGGTLFPALGFFDVYPMRFSFVADHFQYLPSIALIVLVVAAVTTGIRRLHWPRLGLIATVVMIPALGWTTYQRCYAYENEKTLWLDTVLANPQATIAYYNLGSMEMKADAPINAILLFKQAIQVQPGHPLPYINLAAAYKQNKQIDSAIGAYETAISLYTGLEPERGGAHFHLGNLLLARLQYAQAAEQFRLASLCRPKHADTYRYWGDCLLQLKQYAQASESLRQATVLGQHEAQTWYNLGVALQQSRQPFEATQAYQQAIRADRQFAKAYANLGILHAMAGRLPTAIGLLTQAVKIQPTRPVLLNLAKMLQQQALVLTKSGQPRQATQLNHQALQCIQQAQSLQFN